MIFLTVGSDIPFPRLTKQFDLWSKDNPEVETFAQIGHIKPTDEIPNTVNWVEMIPASEFANVCENADVIVAHAGMGSIISALSLGKPIVMLPRHAAAMETRSDHQIATAQRFVNRSGVFVAWKEGELAEAIEKARAYVEHGSMETISRFAPEAFTNRIRDFILA